MAATHNILVGSYTTKITTLSFDAASPSLSVTESLEVGHHPSWLTKLPEGHAPGDDSTSIVFTGLEQSEGKIISLSFDSKGKGKILGEITSGGRDPCTLEVTSFNGKLELIVGNYSSGRVTTAPLTGSTPFIPNDSEIHIVQFEGTGPQADRQEASHPHHVYFYRDEMLVPDLGADKTWRLQRDQDGKWETKGFIQYEAGYGPRHVVVQDDILYTVQELQSKVTAHRLPPFPEPATLISTINTLSYPAASGMLGAELLFPTPTSTFPTQYLYVSNRNDPSSEGDTIGVISTQDGKLELVAEIRTGLKHLRGMLFSPDPESKYLVAGGANGGGVRVFERVDGGKGLKEVAHVDLEAPTAFLWL